MAVLGVQMFRIDVLIVGREHGIFTGTNRVMDRIISAAAAQASKGAVTFTAAAMVRVDTVERPLHAAGERQQQASENDTNQRFGDGLHNIIRQLAEERE